MMRRFLLLLAFFTASAALFIDLGFKGSSLLVEGVPKFAGTDLLRTFLIVLSSCLFVSAIVKPQFSSKVRVIPPSKSKSWADWGVITLSIEESLKRHKFSLTMKELMVWVVLLLSLLFLFVFLYSPTIFNSLALEDRAIEMLSAVLCFLTCGVFLVAAMTLRSQKGYSSRFYLMTLLALAFIFFLIGMEEISWFQRAFSISTPKTFEGNDQNELNLHNFATNKTENCYYFFSFIILIFLPFIKDNTSIFSKHNIRFLIPSNFVLFFSAIFAAYNYEMWNNIFTQTSFFLTLFILLYYLWNKHSVPQTFSSPTFVLLPTLIIVYGLTQILFLMYGIKLVRMYDITEYKEFLIPLSFLMYSLEILNKANILKLSSYI